MTSKQTKSNNRINNFIVNNSKESKDNDKESTDGKFDDFKFNSRGRFGQLECCGGRLMDKIKPKTLN